MDDALEQDQLGLCFFVAGAGGLARLVEPPLHHRQIRKGELAGNDVVIAHRIDGTHDMHDIRILKRPNHVHDGVDFADVRQELIAEAFALRGAFDESGDIDELHDGRNLLLRFDDLVQLLEPWIGDRDDTDVRLDRAERIVLRSRGLGRRQRVEEGRLPDIWKTYDSQAEHQLLSHFSTVSIICGVSASTSFSSCRSNGASTCSAQSPTPSGRGPTPIRRRAYCGDWSAPSMLFSPLCPPADPSGRNRKVPRRS